MQSKVIQAQSGRGFRPFTQHKARQQTCVRAEKDDLKAQILKTNQALEEAKDLVVAKINSTPLEREKILHGREALLWQRQEEMWKQEHARWEKERSSWDAREAVLEAQIIDLQHRLLAISKPSITPVHGPQAAEGTPHSPSPAVSSQSSSPGSASTVAGPETPRQSAPRVDGANNGASAETYRSPPTNSVLDEASQFLPRDSDFTPPSPEDFSPLQAVGSTEDSVSRLRESMQAAFSAVDGDILSTDFSNLEQALSSTLVDSVDVLTGDLLEDSARKAGGQPEGPPRLSKGADDIFWMSQLHGALLQESLFPGEEDMETWSFGEKTLDAVLTYQAINGLPETGIVDDRTWLQLLGENYKEIRPPPEPEGTPTAEEASYTAGMAAAVAAAAADQVSAPSGATESQPDSLLESVRGLRQEAELANRLRNLYTEHQSSTTTEETPDSWPVLREGDGGRNVHRLQVALERNGFIPDSEDQRWWQFGLSTQETVYTFQACSGLPESGVVDQETWVKLLGEASTPDMLSLLTNEFEDDLTDNQGAVWLLGEQRWSRRPKI